MVAAYVTRDIRRHIHVGCRSEVKPDVRSSQRQGLAGSGDVRRKGQLLGGQPRKEVLHRRVADDDGFGDLLGHGAGLAAKIRRKLVQRLDQAALECGRAVLVRHRIVDPADHVLAVADLRIRRAGLGQRLTRRKIDEVAGKFGRSYVDRQPHEARPCGRKRHHLPITYPEPRRPVLSPQLWRQRLEHGQRE